MHILSQYWCRMETCCGIFRWSSVVMYKLYAVLFVFHLIQNVLSVEYKILTNEFAVHIKGGENVAKEIAQKYGFVHTGQIGSLKDHYLFENRNIQKQSLLLSPEPCEMLQSDSSVLWLEQQEIKRRVKRSIPKKSPTFHDPLYPEQWFLLPSSFSWQTLKESFRDIGEVRFAELGWKGKCAVDLMNGFRIEGRAIQVRFY